MKLVAGILLVICSSTSAAAQNRSEDEYTRYELLAPDTASFKIVYDVTAVTPGARFYFNPIRKGSEASDESVIDLMTGTSLKFEEVTGQQARDAGFARADLETHYIKVALARPVPEGGEGRIRILKTYKDAKSYHRDGDAIVFDRPLGIKRNAVVLPAGYELISCNIPVQIIEEADGRIAVSFMNPYPGEAPLVVKARPLPSTSRPAASDQQPAANAPRPPAATAAASVERPMNQIRVSERAFQDREIVYFLKAPETHAFALYHDYTESREGVAQYVNVVRAGSTVSEPSAKILDTGEPLSYEILKGDELVRRKIDTGGEDVSPATVAVVIPFPAVKRGQSVRLRISETYTDPARYALVDGQLLWHRSFGRPRNDVVLPSGWYVTASSMPAVVTQDADGRTRLIFWNQRPDNIDVFLKARKRPTS